MKTMNKILMILLGAALVLSMTGAVAAEGQTMTQAGSSTPVTISIEVEQGYTLTIPEGIAATGSVLSISGLLDSGASTVTVTVSSDDWKAETGAESGVGYAYQLTLSNGGSGTINKDSADKTVLTFSAGDTSKSVTITGKVTATDMKYSGVYTDQLTFTIA